MTPTSVPATATIDVSVLTDEELSHLASSCLEEFKVRQAAGTIKVRCPACNSHLKEWYEYKATYTQIQFLFEIMDMMQTTKSNHVHIKSSSKKVPLEHRDHTVIGDIQNHYSKMMYLGLLERCTDAGESLPQFSYSADNDDMMEESGGVPCFRIPDKAIAFVLGREPLRPAIVRVKNLQILDVPENRESTMWVRDVYSRSKKHGAEREQDWLNRSGQMAIHYPLALEQLDLFEEDEEE